MIRRGLAALVLLLGLAGLAPAARADVRVRGTVVRLEDEEIYFDVGNATGLTAGRPARAWRRIQVKHPVTQKPLTDEIPLGDLGIRAVGTALSVAVAAGPLEYAIRVASTVRCPAPRRVRSISSPPPKG